MSSDKSNGRSNASILAMTVVLMMVGAALAGCVSVDEKKKNKPPFPVISEPEGGAILNVDEVIAFSGNGSRDPEGKDLTYDWRFGDGVNATGMNVTHSYRKAGDYNVTLTVSDGKKEQMTYIFIFINTPPIAVMNVTQMVPVGEDVKFNASGSSDPDDDPLTYAWDFGDNDTSMGRIVEHNYTAIGKYNVTLTVDDGAATDTATMEVEVYYPNVPPVAAFTVGPDVLNNTETITFNASISTDPDGDPLTYGWTFGDGNTSTGMIATHAFELPGSYNVTLTVDDGEFNDSTTKVLGVLQRNRAPVAVLNKTQDIGNIGELMTFDASGSVDPDDDPLTYAWDFGDGTNETGDIVTNTYSNIGIFTIVLTVSDQEFSVNATTVVEIFPRGEILVDWNRDEFAYVIELDDDVDKFEVEANITDETTSDTDTDYHISFTNGTRSVRLSSSLVPVPGHTLNITLTYKGRDVANRVIEVVGQGPVPASTVDATYDFSMKGHSNATDGESWMNMTGVGTMTYEDDRVNQSISVSDSEGWMEETEGTTVTTMTGSYPGTVFNQTMLYNEEEYSEVFMNQEFGMTFTDGGAWSGSMNGTGYERVIDDMTVDIYSEYEGEMMMGSNRLNISTIMYDIGYVEHDNGDGETFDCIMLLSNQTFHGYFPIPPLYPLDHYAMVNESTIWMVQQSENYTNRQIYAEYNMSIFLINDSAGGRWEFLFSDEGGVYLDEDEDGDFNPDPPEVDVDMVTEFEGVAPRELRLGDRVATENEYGAIVTMDVEEMVDVTVGGDVFEAARINVTYSGITDLTGDGETFMVAAGPHTGLLLETHETVEFTDAKGEVQTKYMDIVIDTIT